MAEPGPEREEKQFKFVGVAKARVGPSFPSFPAQRLSLLCVSNKYGLVFVGTSTAEIKIFETKSLLHEGACTESSRLTLDSPARPIAVLRVPDATEVLHVALSCDDLTLAAVFQTGPNTKCYFFDVRNFSRKDKESLSWFNLNLVCTGDDVRLKDLQWNPAQPLTLAYATSDGKVSVIQAGNSLEDFAGTVIVGAKHVDANCLCWSPKGKQLVVGSSSTGGLIQFSPDLMEKKRIAAPPDSTGIVDVFWQSTTFFLAAVAFPDEEQPRLIAVSAAKNEAVKYFDYQDVCFGACEERPSKYFFRFVADWNVIVCSSNNALESSVLGKHPGDKILFERWFLPDEGRAELPLSDSDADTLPIGVAIDTTATSKIALGDNIYHVASPILILLSTDGVLAPFHMINAIPGSAMATIAASPVEGGAVRERADLRAIVSGGAGGTKAPPSFDSSSARFTTPPKNPSTLPTFSTPVKPFPTQPAPSTTPGVSFPHLLGTTSKATPVKAQNPSTPTVETSNAKPFTISWGKQPSTNSSTILSTPQAAPSPVAPSKTTATISSDAQALSARLTRASTPKAPSTLGSKPDPLSVDSSQFARRGSPAADATFAAAIAEELAHFAREMLDHKKFVADIDARVGDEKEMKALASRTARSAQFLHDVKCSMKDLNLDVHAVKMQMMEQLSVGDQAKQRVDNDRDPEYLRLLRNKPLDPSTRRKMKEIRDAYVSVENKLDDVTTLLDAEWKATQEMKRRQRRGQSAESSCLTLASIFTILRNNNQTIVLQNRALSELREQVKSLNLESSSKSSAARGSGDATFSQASTKRSSTLLRRPVFSPERVAKLRESLSKRKVPVVKSHIASGDLAASRLVSATAVSRVRAALAAEKENEEAATTPLSNGAFSPSVPASIKSTPAVSAAPKLSFGVASSRGTAPDIAGSGVFSGPSGLASSSKPPTFSFGSSSSSTPKFTASGTFGFASSAAATATPASGAFSSVTSKPQSLKFESAESESTEADYAVNKASVLATPKAASKFVIGQFKTEGAFKTGFGAVTTTSSTAPAVPAFSFKPTSSNAGAGLTAPVAAAGSPAALVAAAASPAKTSGLNFSFSFGGLSSSTPIKMAPPPPILGSGVDLCIETNSKSKDASESRTESRAETPATTPSAAFTFGAARPATPVFGATSQKTPSSATPSGTPTFSKSPAVSGRSTPAFGQALDPEALQALKDMEEPEATESDAQLAGVNLLPEAQISEAESKALAGVKDEPKSRSGSTKPPLRQTFSVSAALAKPSGAGFAGLGVGAGDAAASSLFVPKATNSIPTGVGISGSVSSSTLSSSTFSSSSGGIGDGAATIFGQTTKPSNVFGVATKSTTTPVSSSISSLTLGSSSSSTTLKSSTLGSPSSAPSSVPSSAPTSATPSSIFGVATSSTLSSSTSIFGAEASTTLSLGHPSSVFGAATATTLSSSHPSLVFGAATSTTLSSSHPSSVFGAATSTTLSSSHPSSVFGAATSTTLSSSHPSSVFGAATSTTLSSSHPSSVFGAATSTTLSSSHPSVFGVATSLAPSSTSSASIATASVFGQAPASATSTTIAPSLATVPLTSVPETSSASSTTLLSTSTLSSSSSSLMVGASASVFAKPATSSTTATSVFGAKSAFGSSSSSSSIFGPMTTNSAPVFGQSSSTTPSLFGAASSAPPKFGSATSTSASNVFGAAPVTAAPTVFGTAPSSQTPLVFSAVSTAAPSIFGAASTTAATNMFGVSTTSASSVFGATSTSGTPSIFGQATTTAAPSLFGAASSTAASNMFGAVTTSDAPSAFGAVSTTASLGFGATPVSSPPVFGQPAASTSSSVFGGGTATGSVFGASTSALFGQKTTTSTVFGQPPLTSTPATTSVFGAPSSGFGAAPSAFGSATPSTAARSIFGPAPVSTSSGNLFGGGGGMFSGLGGQASAESANKNPFGASVAATTGSVFGTPTTSTGTPGLFGASASGFGSSVSTTAKPSGPFSTGGPSLSQGVFGGALSSPPKTPTSSSGSAFGAAPAFAGTAFGSPPAFGASSGFGGAPVFGATSPSKIFGSGTAPASTTTAFGSIANQSTPSFGALASNAPTFGSIAGASNPSFGGFSSAATSGAPPFGSPAPASFGSGTQQATFGSPASPGASGGGGSSFSSWR